MNTKEMAIRHDHGYLARENGIRLFFQNWIPESVVDHMVVVHGLGEHSDRYGNLTSFFCPRGYGVHAMDNRGHGRSDGLRGHVDWFGSYREDLACFIENVRRTHGIDKLLLVGHSLGGLISLSYALAYPDFVRGLVISSPGFRPNKPPPAIKAFIGRILSHAWPTLTLSNEIDPRHISRDREVVERYIHDPLVHDRVSTRFYSEFLKESERVLREAPRLKVPLLLMQAGSDLLVDPQASKEFFSKAGTEDKTLKIYEGFYHELFNEPEKETVFNDIERWLKRRA